jgi:ABC-type multidrug transport system ATPase subunit
VAIIDEGRLLYQGPVEDLMAQDSWTRLRVDRITEAYRLLSQNPQLSVSLNGDESLHLKIAEEEIPRVNALLVEHGFQVMELSPQRESLEQVFLRLTQDARASK